MVMNLSPEQYFLLLLIIERVQLLLAPRSRVSRTDRADIEAGISLSDRWFNQLAGAAN